VPLEIENNTADGSWSKERIRRLESTDIGRDDICLIRYIQSHPEYAGFEKQYLKENPKSSLDEIATAFVHMLGGVSEEEVIYE